MTIRLYPNEATGTYLTSAFVTHRDPAKSGLQTVEITRYADYPFGGWLRDGRIRVGMRLGEFAYLAGLAVRELSGLEHGRLATDADGEAAIRALIAVLDGKAGK